MCPYGHILSPDSDDLVYCPQCHEENNRQTPLHGKKACPNCGEIIAFKVCVCPKCGLETGWCPSQHITVNKYELTKRKMKNKIKKFFG